MTYSVLAFKAAISTGDLSFIWVNNGILLGSITFLAVTFLVTLRLFSRKDIQEKLFRGELIEALITGMPRVMGFFTSIKTPKNSRHQYESFAQSLTRIIRS